MNSGLLQNLKAATHGSSVVRAPRAHTNGRQLRSSSRPQQSDQVRLQLVEDNGVMEWEEVTGALPDLGQFRAGQRNVSVSGDARAEMEFRRLPPSEITQFLMGRDKVLTPYRGLRRYDTSSRQLVPASAPEDGTGLLLIHGTFSNSENLLQHFLDSKFGRRFLQQAEKKYAGNIFTFDHPTLSVSPILNALDLSRELGTSRTQFDLVCHSRGGLVARWWCETIDVAAQRCRKAILVGAPLAGTGLAAPPNIRATINMLTKLGDLLEFATGLASLAVPVLSIVEVLLKVATSLGSFAVKTPVTDALMAMVPGLSGMSRVGNNPELLRLLELGAVQPERYYSIRSNFEPTDPAWKFWQYFRREQVTDAAADLIFDGENDLVVDTPSMIRLSDSLQIPAKRSLNFGTSEVVHHLNYFQQERTINFLADTLL